MDMPRNTFKQALAERRPQLGLFLGLANPISAEIMATCGYDFLLIDAEHGPNNVPLVQSQLQAMAPHPVQCLVRPANHDAALIKQLLGVGAQTLLVPMVDNAEQARAIVSAMHYPPKGIRGVGTGLERGSRWNAVPDYFAQVEANTCLIVQIESRTALQNLDAIAAVEGVDAVFIGPSDLAAALGHIGNPGHPEVQETIRHLYQRVTAQGKAVGILAPVHADARRYLDMGMHFVAVGTDLGVFKQATFALREAFPT